MTTFSDSINLTNDQRYELLMKLADNIDASRNSS